MDNAEQILDHARKYLHARWRKENNFDDYQAFQKLTWLRFTLGEGEEVELNAELPQFVFSEGAD